MFKCNDCDYEAKTEPALQNHRVKHKQAAGYNCDDCNESFGRTRTLMIHSIEKHDGQKCPDCEKRFRNRPYLVMHTKVNHNGLRYACKLCTKEFLSKHGLKRHKNVHLGLKPYMCEFCSKACADPGSLKQHKKMHISTVKDNRKALSMKFSCEKQSALCNDCGVEFNSKDTLSKHVKKQHTKQPRVDKSILKDQLRERAVSLAFTNGVKYSASKFSVRPSLVTKWVKEAGMREEVAQPKDEKSLFTLKKVTAYGQVDNISDKDPTNKQNDSSDEPIKSEREIRNFFVVESKARTGGIEEDLEEGEIKESFENGEDMNDLAQVESGNGDSKDESAKTNQTCTMAIECDLCPFNSIVIENMRSHMKKIHIGAVFICFSCGERCITRYDLKIHKFQTHLKSD